MESFFTAETLKCATRVQGGGCGSVCVWRWGVGGRVFVVRGGSLRRAKSIGLVLCRYLWLLFADEGVMPLDDFVFNMEAHPLRVHPEYQWGAEYGSLPEESTYN